MGLSLTAWLRLDVDTMSSAVHNYCTSKKAVSGRAHRGGSPRFVRTLAAMNNDATIPARLIQLSRVERQP